MKTAKQIQTMSKSELYDAMYDAKKEILGLKLKRSLQENISTAILRDRRREVARIKTVLNSKMFV